MVVRILCVAVVALGLVDFIRRWDAPWRPGTARAAVGDAVIVQLGSLVAVDFRFGGPLRDLVLQAVAFPLWLLWATPKDELSGPFPAWSPARPGVAYDLAYWLGTIALGMWLVERFLGSRGAIAGWLLAGAAVWTNRGYVAWLARVVVRPPRRSSHAEE